ncbi:MAG TPA: tetratricopeptide repeat protein [Thermoanaerobaculia bacterium]|jgi:tetratricopeptide (TPR) repeat protein|nr:tetratricopeptide repeat protein [Thermoanaerobaculia bacterium]
MKTLALLLLLAPAVFAQEAPAPTAPAPNVEEEFTKAVFFGKKFADLGDYASAYDNLAKADALKPDQPPVLYNMGVVLARAGRYSEAQVKVDRYLQLFPDGVEKPMITRLQFELEFQREVQKKRQADQEYADLFNRAKFLYGRAELQEALRIFERAEQLRPSDAAAVFNQALIHEKLFDYGKAIERYRRYAQLEGDPQQKQSIDERVYELQREVEDMQHKIVCSFCGRKLAEGATWCERCWHGPYLTKTAVWNSRPCVEGASATRAMFFSDDRFNKNDILPCMFEGKMHDALSYTPARQREIQTARRNEGWTYANGMLQTWTDKLGNQIRYVQGSEYLEKVTSSVGGEILTYAAHAAGEGIHLLDREDVLIDGQRYTNRYMFDPAGRIAQQQVEYQNTAACNHLINVTADYFYTNDALASANLRGGYEGYPAEGKPKTDWAATIVWAYDEKSRLAKEELAVTSFTKTYDLKPQGALRDDINRLYPSMRVKRPIENVQRTGDLCASSGSMNLANPIDLRPFYAMSPNLGIALQNGVAKAIVTFTYPEGY